MTFLLSAWCWRRQARGTLNVSLPWFGMHGEMQVLSHWRMLTPWMALLACLAVLAAPSGRWKVRAVSNRASHLAVRIARAL
jgi:hypothetical protein